MRLWSILCVSSVEVKPRAEPLQKIYKVCFLLFTYREKRCIIKNGVDNLYRNEVKVAASNI